MAESAFGEFISYYKMLPKVKGTCRIYERSENYSLYGEDAALINQEIFKAARPKLLHSGGDSLSYVNINKLNLVLALKHLLFIRQYRIQILKNTGTPRTPQWTVICKASPGNLTEVEDILFTENGTYVHESKGLMAIKMLSDGPDLVLGVAYCDPVLREIQICHVNDSQELINIQSVLVQLSPQECLLPVTPSSKLSESSPRGKLESIFKAHHIAVSECKAGDFSAADIVQDLNRLLVLEEGQDFNSCKRDESEMKLALSAVTAIIKYLELLSDENNFGQFSLSVFKSDHFAKVDVQAVAGLSLFPESSKDFSDKSYLLGHLNSCQTSAGERLLIQWIKQPLTDLRKLEERLDIVEIFVTDISLQNDAAKHISKFPDIETLSRKIQRRKATLQDLFKLYLMVTQLPELSKTLSRYDGPHADVLKSNFIEELQEKIEDFKNFESMIDSTIDFEAVKNREFIVKAEYDQQLLDLKEKMDDIQQSINSLVNDVIKDLDAPGVKLEYCKIVGYHFRLTRKQEKNLRHKKGYTIIDTKASGVRFHSSSLKSSNEEYMTLKKSYEELQKAIVDQIIDVAVSFTQPMKLLSTIIAWLDVSLAFSRVSVNAPKQYVRPKLKEKGDCCIILKQVRHPVLESKVGNFIPNDVEITKDKYFYFVTGPNMGGKSTYIRSVALSVLLAQIGCFVPCDEAEISLTDAFLTRIGACDKPAKGVSTFMFEMLEVQNILKSATPASLLIIDEMGRGTSTFDGFGLSWSISRHIAEELKSPCLFATHFHELTDLSKSVSVVGNLHVEALTSDGSIIFLYHVKPGVCDESFGIHVTKLAQFPEAVVKRAEEKLKELDSACMSVNEILKTFSAVPGGEVIVQAFQEKCVDENAMDQDSSDNDNLTKNMNPNLDYSSVNESKLEMLAQVLEEFVKGKGL